MSAERATAAGLRRLRRAVSGSWAAAWILGIGLFATVAVRLSDRLQWRDFDAQLALVATATYGLAWFDEEGRFHDEVLRVEGDLAEGAADVWIVEPGPLPRLHVAPSEPRFGLGEELGPIARRVVDTQEELVLDTIDAGGQPCRLHAIPTYQDGVDDVARAAIVVVGDPQPVIRAQRAFAVKLCLAALCVGLLGLGVGFALARWSLRPLATTLDQRERFLRAAAHELRTPVAALRAVGDSAMAGDEAPETALERMQQLVVRTGEVIDDLLLFAQLDAGRTTLEPEDLRLDLLVEACLPEHEQVALDARESVVHADPGLVRVAVRNLLRNALQHACPPASEDVATTSAKPTEIRSLVRDAVVIIEDAGPGFPQDVLTLVRSPFSVAPSHQGAGIGLATAKLIAELHGGSLVLENRPEGGARAVLTLR